MEGTEGRGWECELDMYSKCVEVKARSSQLWSYRELQAVVVVVATMAGRFRTRSAHWNIIERRWNSALHFIKICDLLRLSSRARNPHKNKRGKKKREHGFRSGFRSWKATTWKTGTRERRRNARIKLVTHNWFPKLFYEIIFCCWQSDDFWMVL